MPWRRIPGSLMTHSSCLSSLCLWQEREQHSCHQAQWGSQSSRLGPPVGPEGRPEAAAVCDSPVPSFPPRQGLSGRADPRDQYTRCTRSAPWLPGNLTFLVLVSWRTPCSPQATPAAVVGGGNGRSWPQHWNLPRKHLTPQGAERKLAEAVACWGQDSVPHLSFFSENGICFPRVKVLDQQTLQVVFHSLLHLHGLHTWEKMEALPKAAPHPIPQTAQPVYQGHRALPPQ